MGEITTGASKDIEVATMLARKMVATLGMSKLGPTSFEGGEAYRMPFETSAVSEETKHRIDRELESIINDCHQRAKGIIEANRKKLDKVVKALLEKETLESEEFKELIK